MRKIVCIVLGLVVAASGRGVIGVEAATATSAPATRGASTQAVGIRISSPMDYEVIQRGADGEGVVDVEAEVSKELGAMSFEVSFTRDRPAFKPVVAGSLGKVSLPAGGWYRVDVRAMDGSGREVASAVVEHMGIGEVFMVGGQSNSTNFGEVKTKSESGMVGEFDGKAWTLTADPLPGVDGKGGSPWCLFGDMMVARLKVPVGIVPVGRGSTSVRQWLPKGDIVKIEPTRNFGLTKLVDGTWESEGQLFDRMVLRMKQLGSNGFRAMLWHQGESDAHQAAGHTLPGADYRVDLERVIKESRKEVGWEVPWFVATASWGTPSSPADPDIRAAQAGVVADGVAMAGPDTDTLIGENRQRNGTGVHMSAVGLKAHAALWAGIVGKWVEGENRKPKTEIRK